jgi:hypothetical protein
MPYVLAGSFLEYRQFLTAHGLAPEIHTYLSRPEQLLGYHGPIVLVGTYSESPVWESTAMERAILERLLMSEDTYLLLHKEKK